MRLARVRFPSQSPGALGGLAAIDSVAFSHNLIPPNPKEAGAVGMGGKDMQPQIAVGSCSQHS
jgi:hypothetical protein